jgi:hypothetical protein
VRQPKRRVSWALGRFAEAQLAHVHAHALAPQLRVHLAFLAGTVKERIAGLESVPIDLAQKSIVDQASANR